MNFEELLRRVVAYLREIVQNGDMSERRLARATGVSQPHIHHVLSGKRRLSAEMADQVLHALHNDLLDFIEPAEIEEWKNRG